MDLQPYGRCGVRLAIARTYWQQVVDGRDGRDGRERTGRTWTDGTDVDGRDGRDGRRRTGRTWTDGTDVDGRDGRDWGTTFCYFQNEIYDIGTEILYKTCFVNNSTQKASPEELQVRIFTIF